MSVKLSGLHLKPDAETRSMLASIDRLTFVSYEDILKLGCKMYLEMHHPEYNKREQVNVSTAVETSSDCEGA